jgi:hypothetical protein
MPEEQTVYALIIENRVTILRLQPSFIRTVPSAPEFHRIMHVWRFHIARALAGFTADRELVVNTRSPLTLPRRLSYSIVHIITCLVAAGKGLS